MKTDGIFSMFKNSVTGLTSQMKRLEVISENIANAEVAPDENGNIYNRKIVMENSRRKPQRNFGDQMVLKLKGSDPMHITSKNKNEIFTDFYADQKEKLEVVEIEEDKYLYDPAHPRADENGYVQISNVNVIEEMVEMVSASRAYEANISVMNAAKQVAKKTIQI